MSNNNLTDIISELSQLTDEEMIITHLQRINELLLTNYNLEINNLENTIIIEPLQVEIYYCNEEKRFIDGNLSHKIENKQNNNFGKLYLHKKGRGGVDVCLADSKEFFLSVLIKASRINGEYYKQVSLFKKIRDIIDVEKKCVLTQNKQINCDPVFITKRKGVAQKYEEGKLLGAIIEIDVIDNSESPFSFEKGYGKEITVVENISRTNLGGEKNIQEYFSKYLGYIPKNYK